MTANERYAQLAPFIIVVIGLSIIGALSFSALYSQGYHAADLHRAAELAPYKTAEADFQACMNRPTKEAALQCYREAQAASRAEFRDESDLNAQRQMADWARLMFYSSFGIGVLSVLITVAGVLYVRDTLVQTRLGTAAAIKAANAAAQELTLGRRPWLAITGIELATPVKIEPQNDRGHFTIHVRVKNTGSTPAQTVWPYFKVYDAGMGGYRPGEGLLTLLKEAKAGNRNGIGFTLFPDQEDYCWLTVVTDPREFNGGNFARPKAPNIVGFINYYSAHDDTAHQTGFDFTMSYRGGNSAVMPDTGSEFPAKDFAVSKSAMGQFAT